MHRRIERLDEAGPYGLITRTNYMLFRCQTWAVCFHLARQYGRLQRDG